MLWKTASLPCSPSCHHWLEERRTEQRRSLTARGSARVRARWAFLRLPAVHMKGGSSLQGGGDAARTWAAGDVRLQALSTSRQHYIPVSLMVVPWCGRSLIYSCYWWPVEGGWGHHSCFFSESNSKSTVSMIFLKTHAKKLWSNFHMMLFSIPSYVCE